MTSLRTCPLLSFLLPAAVGLTLSLSSSLAADDRLLPVLSEKPLTDGEGSDEFHKLLVARYNAALSEVQKRFRYTLSDPRGATDQQALRRAAKHLLKAGLELSGDPDKKLEAYRTHLELAKHLEKLAGSADRVGLVTDGLQVDEARYFRLNAEIKLHRAMQRAAAPTSKWSP